ncbi:hypothetical protein CORC01_01958 [Colletotrichum orchidophilum]|uniref:Uncharacterized protein n=1 Tax=Colletotrichum orchidophilum TaxID=1209926 RepID=A0A1G4BNG0_9PEZI|nr:uncharacterized protein CORC01_01958 [Colletotrichum orchidophilum]OHF02857.1 hypothetical protein CORC01_01958 [Colletotrichum orchidophilum]
MDKVWIDFCGQEKDNETTGLCCVTFVRPLFLFHHRSFSSSYLSSSLL